MNRVINNPDLVVEDMLRGWLLAHADTSACDNPRVVKRLTRPGTGQGGHQTGGGSGMNRRFSALYGMARVDAVAIGEIFLFAHRKELS